MAKWRDRGGLFPAPLEHFREEDWPPVVGECLEIYACRAAGYGQDCAAEDAPCGWRTYAAFERDYPPDRAAELTRRYREADAYQRFTQARLAWIGEDHDLYLQVYLDGCGVAAGIRHPDRHAYRPN